MSVIAEFTLPVESFPLGTALRTSEELEIELERIVPVSGHHIPYIWVRNGDFERFESEVCRDENVADIVRVDQVDDRALYRIEWAETDSGLVNGIQQADAAIMDASAGSAWHFQLHFLDHDRLGRFYNHCTEHGIPIHLERVYTLAEASGEGRAFDLTPDQREALVLALRRGYFSSPREISLADLAEEVGISKQALSQRIRKANEQVLREALLSSSLADR
ncbi:MAG: helix-turn-helix domain-containing protein [Halapricum sp.]